MFLPSFLSCDILFLKTSREDVTPRFFRRTWSATPLQESSLSRPPPSWPITARSALPTRGTRPPPRTTWRPSSSESPESVRSTSFATTTFVCIFERNVRRATSTKFPLVAQICVCWRNFRSVPVEGLRFKGRFKGVFANLPFRGSKSDCTERVDACVTFKPSQSWHAFMQWVVFVVLSPHCTIDSSESMGVNHPLFPVLHNGNHIQFNLIARICGGCSCAQRVNLITSTVLINLKMYHKCQQRHSFKKNWIPSHTRPCSLQIANKWSLCETSCVLLINLNSLHKKCGLERDSGWIKKETQSAEHHWFVTQKDQSIHWFPDWHGISSRHELVHVEAAVIILSLHMTHDKFVFFASCVRQCLRCCSAGTETSAWGTWCAAWSRTSSHRRARRSPARATAAERRAACRRPRPPFSWAFYLWSVSDFPLVIEGKYTKTKCTLHLCTRNQEISQAKCNLLAITNKPHLTVCSSTFCLLQFDLLHKGKTLKLNVNATSWAAW